jgi:hypothetical protein
VRYRIEQVNRDEKRAFAQSVTDQVLTRLKQDRIRDNNDAKLPFPWWGKALFYAVGAIFVSGTVETIRVESKLSGYDVKVGDLDTDVKGLSTVVDNLPQQISKAAISKAKKAAASKDFDTSVRALDLSSALLRVGAANRLTAPPEFFEETTNQLDSIEKEPFAPLNIRLSIHAAREALASYRTSITQLPTTNGRSMTPLEYVELARQLGYTPLLAPPGVEQFEFDFKSEGLSNADYLHDFALVGGQQILDQHARWRHVLFVNMKIIYHGGPLDLSDVTFVNCTFDTTPDSPNTTALLEAAALAKRSATIS